MGSRLKKLYSPIHGAIVKVPLENPDSALVAENKIDLLYASIFQIK
jgi:hypothetical protein